VRPASGMGLEEATPFPYNQVEEPHYRCSCLIPVCAVGDGTFMNADARRRFALTGPHGSMYFSLIAILVRSPMDLMPSFAIMLYLWDSTVLVLSPSLPAISLMDEPWARS